VAALQAGLAALLWLALGYWNAQHSWLLEPAQERALSVFFWRELPLLGALFVVLLPAVWIYRLADEATLDVAQDTPFLERVLAFPRTVAIVDMAASVALFFFGAIQVRFRALAPAIEAAKITAFGFLTGVLFGILSYFLLQPVIRPLLLSALARGARPPARPGFPLTQKIVVSCLAISFAVTGLFGELALSWAQRFAEARAEEHATSAVARLAARAMAERPRDAGGWGEFFRRHARPAGTGTVFALDSYGRLLGVSPDHPSRPDARLLRSADWREMAGRIASGSVPFRSGESRILAVMPLYANWRIGMLVPPDRRVLARFLVSALPVTGEVFLLSVVLAVAVGRGLSRPLRDLESRTREFGRDPDASGTPLAPADDEIGALASSFAAMEEEIRSVQSRLRETERRAAAAELLAGVAHEVRNPLFGITSTAAALAGDLADDPRVARHLAVIRKESERLSRMMEEMLSLQRAPRRSAETVALAPVLRSAADAVRSRLSQRSPEISIECPEDLALADADREKIESVFANLFENAILSAERPVQISCRARRESSEAVVEVEDDGPGLAPELHGRIFEPFVTSRPGGTGIGLAVCRQIVTEHGGIIGATAPPGGPAVFRIRLPSV
jgi:signal transduction histidine kinase